MTEMNAWHILRLGPDLCGNSSFDQDCKSRTCTHIRPYKNNKW